MTKNKLLLSIAILTLFQINEVKAQKFIVGGDFDYPPFSFIDKTGSARGTDIDLLNAIAAETGMTFEYQLSKWDSALNYIVSGRTDIIIGIIFSEERENELDFTYPVHTESYSIFIRKDIRFRNITDLQKYRLMILPGDISIKKFLIPSGLFNNYIEVKSFPEALAGIEGGKADDVIAPHWLGMNEIEKNKYENIEVKGPPVISSIYCLAVKKGNTKLLGILNKGITALRDSGELSKIQEKWLLYDRDEFKYKRIAKYIGIIFLLVVILLGIAFIWVISLRNQIKVKTASIFIKNEELQKLNVEKDKFLSIIAHDLRSPFNTIVGFSRILVELGGKKDIDKMVEYSTIIRDASLKAMDLLQSMLEWSLSQTDRLIFNPENFEMNDLIDEILLLFSDSSLYKSINLAKQTDTELHIFADKAMLRIVLRNLISNALKFTQPGGNILIKGTMHENNVVISVVDSGTGIEKSVADKLFKNDTNFTKTGTQNEQGSGLGLFLCKEFIDKHEGKIWVDSNPGKGAIFSFTIPLRGE